jgi:hypothetical protein
MKAKTKILALVCAVSLILTGNGVDQALAAKKPALSSTTLTLTKGKSKVLKVKNTTKKVTWSILSGKKVVTLKQKGKTATTVIGKQKGTAKVQALVGKTKLTCKVTVKNAEKNTYVDDDDDDGTIIRATDIPANYPRVVLATSTPASVETPEPTAAPIENTDDFTVPKEANQQDVAAVEKILQEQKDTTIEQEKNFIHTDLFDLSNEDYYTWTDGRLTGINWNCRNLRGNLSFATLTELSVLDCGANWEMTGLDVSKNTKLEVLTLASSKLNSLDVSNNTALKTLIFSYNAVSNIDLSNNVNLTKLYCEGNQISNLDVSNNTSLEELSCFANLLTGIDVSNNADLKILYCGENQINHLDVSNNLELTLLSCGTNPLDGLDVSKNAKLETLDCWEAGLTSLDVSNNLELNLLTIAGNKLTNLDVSNNTKLEFLNCVANQLSSLDVSNNVNLNKLMCTDNQITSLDLTNNPLMIYATCDEDVDLTGYDLSKNEDMSEEY